MDTTHQKRKEHQRDNEEHPTSEEQDTPTSLVQWQLIEERWGYTKDKEILLILIGSGATILAIIAKTYILAALIIIATGVFTYLGRQKTKKKLFNITSTGVFLENDFLPIEEIHGFNIIDDPGERARLILEIERMIHINEVVPIYDVHITEIEAALKELGIKKKKELKQNIFDHLVKFI